MLIVNPELEELSVQAYFADSVELRGQYFTHMFKPLLTNYNISQQQKVALRELIKTKEGEPADVSEIQSSIAIIDVLFTPTTHPRIL